MIGAKEKVMEVIWKDIKAFGVDEGKIRDKKGRKEQTRVTHITC